MKKIIATILILISVDVNAQTTATIAINTNDTWATIDSTMVGFSFNPTYIGMNFSSSYNGVNTQSITTNLFNNFYPFQQPAIRINATNGSYWKSSTFKNAPNSYNANSSVFNCLYCPSGVPSTNNSITVSDLTNVQSFINTLAYKPSLYWGVNLAFIDTARVAEFCSNIKTNFNNNSTLKFELGNEPDAFVSNGTRTNGYRLSSFISEFNFVANKVKNYGSVVAPAYSKANPTSTSGWADSIGYFIDQTAASNVSTISMHSYPLGAAGASSVNGFLNKYLSDSYTGDIVRNSTTGLYPSINTALQNNLSFRLAESNTISSGGTQGASDAMGSALWAIDMMFELAKTKAIGINFAIEGSSTAYYSPFTYSSSQVVSPNKVLVNPIYYGALLFARAAQNNATIVTNTITNQNNNPNIKVWTVLDTKNTIRVVIINRGTSITDTTTGTFTVSFPGNANPGYTYTLKGDNAPSIQSTTVTLAGQKVDLLNGNLTGRLNTTAILPNNGNYTVNVAAGTATMIEIYNGIYCNCSH